MAVIKKDARGGRGTYATLASVVNYVDEQGFDLQWPTQLVDGRLYVDTAVLTYARRYSTCGAFGLATTDDDGETSGYKKRSVKGMTDEQKTQIDRILEDCKIPVGQENGFIGNVLQTRVAYGTLTEYQAQRFIDAYRQHNDKVKEAPSEQ